MKRLTEDELTDVRRYFDLGAYYFSFDATGCDDVDLVLAAVCRAGKHHHHTNAWADRSEWNGQRSVVDVIQDVANHAAASIRARREQDLTSEDRKALRWLADDMHADVATGGDHWPPPVFERALAAIEKLLKGADRGE